MGVQKALGLEDEYGQKIDKCLTDAFIKIGAGLTVGGLFSLVLFKKKMWPVTLGVGIGTGLTYGNCQTIMRYHYLPDYMKTESLVNKVEKLELVQVPSLESDEHEQISETSQNITDMRENIKDESTMENSSTSDSDDNCEHCSNEE